MKLVLQAIAGLAFLISLPAFAAKERILTRDSITDPQLTALIVPGKGTGNVWVGRASASLEFITDLSVPEEARKPIKLSSFFSQDLPRVNPGKYLVQVNCTQSGTYTFVQTFAIPIDTKPGKKYVLHCAGSRPASRTIEVEETDQLDGRSN